VIIPTFNEEKNIGGLVSRISAKGLTTLVIDDGSSDKTSEIAKESGAKVIRNAKNQGKGASLKAGFKYALSDGFEAVITMDGDGQHCIDDIDRFIEAAKDGDTHIIIGNRMNNTSNMPAIRYLTNKFTSWVISNIVGQKIPDTQCGFRLIKSQALKTMRLDTSKYETESEILIRVARMGYKIHSIPIKTIYLSKKSQINPFVDTLRFFRFLFSELFQ